MAKLLAKVAAGSIFGAGLTASGVHSPWVVVSQMRMVNFHMLQVFLVGSASSAVAIVMAQKLGMSRIKPRSPESLGWFSQYDGNIIGGIILGFGMALGGACPGTVLAQVGAGVHSGYLSMIGAILGGIVWTPRRLSPKKTQPIEEKDGKKDLTIYDQFQMTENRAILVFEILCLSVVFLAAFSTEAVPNRLVNPIVGGLFIGVGQATSLALTGDTVGLSAAYGQFVSLCHWGRKRLIGGNKLSEALPQLGALAFGIGAIGGSMVFNRKFPTALPGGHVSISAFRAILGGFAMVFGARIAGGCTSGHGISGMSTLSKASIVTVASIFSGGMVLAAMLDS